MWKCRVRCDAFGAALGLNGWASSRGGIDRHQWGKGVDLFEPSRACTFNDVVMYTNTHTA